MKCKLPYIICLFILSLLLFSCQEQQNDPENVPQADNLYYDCMESKIVITGKATVEDNERGQWSVTFDGQMLCESEPINNAEVNVKFPVRDTDLTVKTQEAGNFTIKLSRIEENPRGKEFVVTLMGTNDKMITKSFKVD